jgi:DNA-binding CsgD family transcriptional regulator
VNGEEKGRRIRSRFFLSRLARYPLLSLSAAPTPATLVEIFKSELPVYEIEILDILFDEKKVADSAYYCADESAAFGGFGFDLSLVSTEKFKLVMQLEAIIINFDNFRFVYDSLNERLVDDRDIIKLLEFLNVEIRDGFIALWRLRDGIVRVCVAHLPPQAAADLKNAAIFSLLLSAADPKILDASSAPTAPEIPYSDIIDILSFAVISIEKNGNILTSNRAAKNIGSSLPITVNNTDVGSLYDSEGRARLYNFLSGNISSNILKKRGNKYMCYATIDNSEFVISSQFAENGKNSEEKPIVSFFVELNISPARKSSVIWIIGSAYELTDSETRVLELFIKGFSPAECARRLGLSLPTIRTHLSRIFEKTSTKGQVELRGLIERLQVAS